MIKASLKYDASSEMFIKGMSKIIPAVMLTAMKQGMLFGEGISKKMFGKPGNLKSRTGHLRRNIKMDVSRKGYIYTGYLFNKVKYAAIHEVGGTIKAKPGKWLMFKIGEDFIKTKQVKIPARPFLTPGLMAAKNKLSIEIIPSLVKARFRK